MDVPDKLKLVSPVIASVVGAIVVTNVSLEMLGLGVKYLTLGAAGVIGLAYVVLGGIFVGYRGLTKIANLAWGNVFEKHNDDSQTVTDDDIPSRRRVFIAWAALRTRDILSFSDNGVGFDEYYTKMTSSLGSENPQ